jgi:Mn2+/Fe2+ NRAMP family transporter
MKLLPSRQAYRLAVAELFDYVEENENDCCGTFMVQQLFLTALNTPLGAIRIACFPLRTGAAAASQRHDADGYSRCVFAPRRAVHPYSICIKYLKWLTLSLFAYPAIGFFVKIPWLTVLHATVIPHVTLSRDFLMAMVAVLGTTISPYLFFWQASQEAEEVKTHKGEKPLKRAPAQAPEQLGRIRTDTLAGMAFSNAVAFFIILTTAVTLHAQGLTDIATCAQAAAALKPIAGRFAFALFTCGIVGTGLLAVPVLASSAAYGIAEGCRWKVSLEKKPHQAAGFYAAIAAAIVMGLVLNFIHVDPVRALFWAAVLNGVTAAPLMAVIMLLASNRKVAGKFVVPPYFAIVGWCATIIMFCVSAGVLLTAKN